MMDDATRFYNFLILHGYRDADDYEEDIELMKQDFIKLKEVAPRLYNLLREIGVER